jgi:hypothetical protein
MPKMEEKTSVVPLQRNLILKCRRIEDYRIKDDILWVFGEK